MNVNLKLLTMAAAAFLAYVSAVGQAAANDAWIVDSACGQGHRISHTDAKCLNGGWNNNPGFWSGNAGGADYWLQSYCYGYGLVYASVDVTDTHDRKFKLSTGSVESEGLYSPADVRDIACCINHGDQLCHKDQVEKNSSGQIRHVTVTGSSYSTTWVDVSTQRKRYEFCTEYPDYIYCDVNPEGDAKRNPYNCGDHYCTVGDCNWHWEQSSAHDSCSPIYTMSISAEDGTSQRCSLTVLCAPAAADASGTMTYKANEFRSQVWNLDDLHNCNGTLQIGAC